MAYSDRGSRTPLLLAVGAVALLGGGYAIGKLTTKPAPAEAPKPLVAAPQGPAQLEVPQEHLKAVGIVVEPVTAGAFAAEIIAPATVAPTPAGQAVVTAHAAGAVTRLTKRLGDPVRAGEVLALVESREASTIASDRAVAEARLRQAREVAQREQRLFEQRVSPRQDLEAAQAQLAVAEAEMRRSTAAAGAARVSGDGRSVSVVSPISGRVSAQPVALGSYVQPETELFRIADPRATQVQVSVTATDATRIAPADAAAITTSAGATLLGKVRSVTPALDPQTRSATVVLDLSGNVGQLLPGETLQARITPRSAGPTGIVIPEEAIQVIDGRDSVFVKTTKGFVVRPVTVGSRAAGRASILAGLNAGESVATRNAFLLKAELNKGGDEE
jgi:membrane fusion protein, heavy metal efflux system